MVSSKLDDEQDQAHFSLFTAISKRVAFIKSHMLSVSHPTEKNTDPDSSISEVIPLRHFNFYYLNDCFCHLSLDPKLAQ
jgi:hypothetical protein